MPDSISSDPGAVRVAVLRVLRRLLSSSGRSSGRIDDSTKLLEIGLIDSEDLIEIILEVEQECGCQFDPNETDLENGLTLGGLIASFVSIG